VVMQSDGSPWRPLVHILDIARAFAQALVAPRDVVHNQAFNVGRVGENYRVREVADLVAAVLPGVSVSCAPGATPDIRDYRVDFGKIHRAMPAYRPQWTVRQGIEELSAAYARSGLTADDFAGPRYFRLRTVQQLIDRGDVDVELRQVARR
jgi:nucleoside-diphosphate-sugar epimerase